MNKPHRILALISGNGSNLQALIDHQGQYQIMTVISNNPDAYGLTRAQQAHIAHFTLNHRDFSSRADFDSELVKMIDAQQPDLIVLAGFMRRLTPGFVAHYLGRMINIHPSLLPKYPGLHTHQRVLEAGDKAHGCSIHYVTEALDGGPVIAQMQLDILPDDTPDSLQKRVHKLEHTLYPTVVNWIASGQLKWDNAHPKLDNKSLPKSGILLNI